MNGLVAVSVKLEFAERENPVLHACRWKFQ